MRNNLPVQVPTYLPRRERCRCDRGAVRLPSPSNRFVILFVLRPCLSTTTVAVEHGKQETGIGNNTVAVHVEDHGGQ